MMRSGSGTARAGQLNPRFFRDNPFQVLRIVPRRQRVCKMQLDVPAGKRPGAFHNANDLQDAFFPLNAPQIDDAHRVAFHIQRRDIEGRGRVKDGAVERSEERAHGVGDVSGRDIDVFPPVGKDLPCRTHPEERTQDGFGERVRMLRLRRGKPDSGGLC